MALASIFESEGVAALRREHYAHHRTAAGCILQPLRGHLRLTIEKNDNVSPKVAVESALEVVGVTISETQYHLLLGILSQFSAGMVPRARARQRRTSRVLTAA
jgi:hypothetical protein